MEGAVSEMLCVVFLLWVGCHLVSQKRERCGYVLLSGGDLSEQSVAGWDSDKEGG